LGILLGACALSLLMPRRSSEKCACGMDPSQILYYQSLSAHASPAAPRLLGISVSGRREIITIGYSGFRRNGMSYQVVVHTDDGGRTWVKDVGSPPKVLPPST